MEKIKSESYNTMVQQKEKFEKSIKLLSESMELINDSIISDQMKKITGLEIELLNLKKRISFYRKEFFKGNDFTRQYIEEFKNFIY